MRRAEQAAGGTGGAPGEAMRASLTRWPVLPARSWTPRNHASGGGTPLMPARGIPQRAALLLLVSLTGLVFAYRTRKRRTTSHLASREAGGYGCDLGRRRTCGGAGHGAARLRPGRGPGTR